MKTRTPATRVVITLAVVALFMLTALPVAEASTPISSSNCSSTACHVKGTEPTDPWIRSCYSYMSLSTVSGAALNQGGQGGGCGSADFYTVNSGGNVLSYTEVNSKVKLWVAPANAYLWQDFVFTSNGENIHMRTNLTPVINGTLITYTLHNHGDQPWDFGFKYSYDLQVDSNNGAPVVVHNRPGNGAGVPHEHFETGEIGNLYNKPTEYDFGPTTTDVNWVKSWETDNGPDGPNDPKVWFWWHPEWGGTPADLLQFIDSSGAYGQASSFMYQVGTRSIGGDTELQWYYGVPNLIHLEPDDGVDGEGLDEVEFNMWIATNPVEPLISYSLQGSFLKGAPGQIVRTNVVDAGQTSDFPVRIQSLTGVEQNTNYPVQVKLGYEEQYVPAGWDVELLDSLGQPAPEFVTLETLESLDLILRVKTTEDSYGNDQGDIAVTAEIVDKPKGAFNKDASAFDVKLFTSTLIRPDYGIKLVGDENKPEIFPGETATFFVDVTNLGNLRDPFGIDMSIPSGLDAGWDTSIKPQTFALGRGDTKTVQIDIKVPEDSFGGERTLVTRASVKGQNTFNTTLLKFDILSDAQVRVIPDQEEIPITPGGTQTVGATISNLAPEAVTVDFRAVADRLVGADGDGDDGWVVDVQADSLDEPIPPGQSARVQITITAPDMALAGQQQKIVLTLSPEGDTVTLDRALIRAMVERQSDVDAEASSGVNALSGDPGSYLDFSVDVRNIGNTLENLTVEMVRLPSGWSTVVNPASGFKVDVGQTKTVLLGVRSTDDALAGSYDLKVALRNADQQVVDVVPLKVTINQIYGASLNTETPAIQMLPTDTANILVELVNTGNGLDQFMMGGIPPNWDVEVTPALTRELQPGERALIWINGTVTGNLGEHKATLEAISNRLGESPANADGLELTLMVSRPDLVVKNIRIQKAAERIGDVETVVAEIENLGGIEAKDVTVELRVDGKPTGIFVNFERVAPGPARIASMAWTKTAGEHSYEVIVDPLNLHDEGPAEDNNRAVFRDAASLYDDPTFLGPDGGLANSANVPGAPVFGLLALLGVVVAIRRRME